MPSTSAKICNAESARPLIADFPAFSLHRILFDWLDGYRGKLRTLKQTAGLTPDAPCRFVRERHEIVAGKIMLLDSLIDDAAPLVCNLPADLTGRKPILQAITAERAMYVKNLREIDIQRLSPAYKQVEWNRADEAVMVLDRLLKISGSAEEQPETREDVPRACPGGRTLSAYNDAQLAVAFAVVSEALESRGILATLPPPADHPELF